MDRQVHSISEENVVKAGVRCGFQQNFAGRGERSRFGGRADRRLLLPPPVPARKTVLFLHDAVDTVGRDCEQPVLQPFDTSLLA